MASATSEPSPRAARLDRLGVERLRALLATVASAYLELHVFGLAGSAQSRSAFVLGVGEPAKLGLLAYAVLGLFALLVGLTLAPRSASGESSAQRWLERALALLMLVFAGAHALQVRQEPGPHASAGTVYDTLTSELGTPLWLVVYTIGITATCGHLGLTLLSWAEVIGPHTAARVLFVRGAAFVVSATLWLGALSLLSRLALGAGLF